MKKTTGILINDIHLDKNNILLVKDIFLQAVKTCKKYNTKKIFIGGDVFTNRSGQPLTCLTAWKEILDKLNNLDIQLHVIPGNHDKTDADDERSYLDIFSTPNFHLYRTSTVKIFSHNLVLIFIPYFSEKKWKEEFEKASEILNCCFIDKDISDNAKVIIITHMGFDGVRNNDGSEVVSSIKPKDFKDFEKILIGHYHDSSKLSDNVIYTGSAYQNNYGENITDKGFTVIFEDGSLEHVKTKFPCYIKEKINASDVETLKNLIEKYEGEDYDNIRFVFSGSELELQKINVESIKDLGIDCKFESKESQDAIIESDSDSVLKHNKNSILSDFLSFCNSRSVKGKKLKFGLNLIKKIKNVES